MKKTKSIHSGSPQRRQDILDAALEVFTESGITEAPMAEICHRAGASVGSVYHHFSSKENLAAQLYLEGIARYQEGLLEKFDGGEAREVIEAVIRYHCTWVQNNREMARFLARWRHEPFIKERDAELLELNKHFARSIGDWFRGRIEEGSIRKMQWDMIIALLLGPAQEYVRIYLNEQAPTSMESAVESLAEAAWLTLRKT